ncbi:hypothetical protein DMB42_11845 [Nonomuraea sp. WAC 01424]|uniref:hypothetical protein n=1 Tax=Nonomuraea sp. WAC 01424 TaxID=2203200 RepID=UPI000F76EE80|nr:hypothetical protein [Nonomuraea sp. WAC 01424]RSN12863.1 hypothetical protein DMB42_11845 [Nonomuraea sp. WAC 01424]
MNKVLETLAAYTYAHQLDQGGTHLRTALLAAVLTERHKLTPGEALDLACGYSFDDRVRPAGDETDRLIDQARRADFASQAEAVA